MAAPGGIASGLSLWLRADVGTSTTTNGSAVTTWTDQSSNAYAVAGAIGGGPLYRTAGLKGLPSLEFSGTVGFVPSPAGILALTNAVGGVSVFSVVIDTSGGTATYTITAFSVGTSASLSRASATHDLGHYKVGGRRLDANSFASVSSSSSTDASAHVESHLFDYTNALASHYADGVQQVAPTVWLTAGSTSATDSSAVGIGISCDSANLGWIGQISEIAVYNRLVTTAERATIETDMLVRWGFSPPPRTSRQPMATLIRASAF